MIEIFLVSSLVLFAAGLLLASRLHRRRSVEELISSIAKVTENTRAVIESMDVSSRKIRRMTPALAAARDLCVFWWNSRLFVAISNELAAGVQSPEVNSIADNIRHNHKELQKLVVASWGERMMSGVLRIRLASYQRDSIARYVESEELLCYLVSYWHPQGESILGEKI